MKGNDETEDRNRSNEQNAVDHLENKKTTAQEHRLTRRGAVAGASAGMMMSLMSRPVLGAMACSPSALASGNTSSPEKECDGRGCSYIYWKSNLQSWPAVFTPGTVVQYDKSGNIAEMNSIGGTLFTDFFGFQSVLVGKFGGQVTFLDVLQWAGEFGDQGLFEANLVAGALNATAAEDFYGASAESIKKLGNSVGGGDPNYGPIAFGDAFELLLRMNETGDCFLGDGISGSAIDQPELTSDGNTIFPNCPVGYRYHAQKMACVPDNSFKE